MGRAITLNQNKEDKPASFRRDTVAPMQSYDRVNILRSPQPPCCREMTHTRRPTKLAHSQSQVETDTHHHKQSKKVAGREEPPRPGHGRDAYMARIPVSPEPWRSRAGLLRCLCCDGDVEVECYVVKAAEPCEGA